MELSKEDWKLFRERLPHWQEAYMDRLICEYIEMLQSPRPASEKFWALDKRIKQDRQNPGVILDVRRSSAIFDIAMMLRTGVIEHEDLDGFSEDVIETVNYLNKR